VAADPNAEGRRLEDALSRSLSELATLRARLPHAPDSELTNFEGKRMILEDEEFVGWIRKYIADGCTAEGAVLRVIDELSTSFLAIADNQLPRAHN
jgi:phosphoenolpyruvate-protein kinase (PTS system EI component)